MKHKHLKHLFTALLLLVATVASAHDFEVDGIYYNITNSATKEVEVTFQGNSSTLYYEYTGNVVIPESVVYNGVTYNVTAIGYDAFRSCSGLTSVEIPNSVTSIGSSAFNGCYYLTSIEIPNSVITIGGDAFKNTSWYDEHPDGAVYAGKVFYKYKGTMPENTSIVIKEGAISIAASAFSGCSALTSIVIPNSVTNIGSEAFKGCI